MYVCTLCVYTCTCSQFSLCRLQCMSQVQGTCTTFIQELSFQTVDIMTRVCQQLSVKPGLERIQYVRDYNYVSNAGKVARPGVNRVFCVYMHVHIHVNVHVHVHAGAFRRLHKCLKVTLKHFKNCAYKHTHTHKCTQMPVSSACLTSGIGSK